ncbi:hypothetical protein [uncultured Jannaschia sp.]|nr:hypothetical protein [uncultured Jannaschia sp.]
MLLAIMSVSTPALANHPGDQLGEAMEAKEPAFEQAGATRPA